MKNGDNAPARVWGETGLIFALLSLNGMAVFCYGARAAVLALFCVGVCTAADLICLALRRKKPRKNDMDAVTAGLTLSAMLPVSVPLGAAAAAGIFGICIAKHTLGEKDCEIFNSAAAGYIFAELTFPEVFMYPAPFKRLPLSAAGETALYASFSRSVNSGTTDPLSAEYDLLTGKLPGPAGASLVIMVIVCAFFLMAAHSVSPAVLLSLTGTVLTLECLIGGASPLMTLGGGMFLFTALFIVSRTDMKDESTGARVAYGIISGLIIAAASEMSPIDNPAVYCTVICAPFARLCGRFGSHFSRLKRAKGIFGKPYGGESNEQ